MNVFLTGATGGIGSEIKKILETNSIQVICPNKQDLDLEKDIDVSNYGEFDGFIHCAGINILSKHEDIGLETFQKVFNINTFSFIQLCSKLKFINGANIIAIGSLYSTFTKESRLQYSASKHALYAAVKTIALEKSKDTIKVNMVSPGFVDTKMTRKNNSEDRINYLQNNIPLGLVSPLEIANFCLYLIKQNSFITGQNITIDGGCSLKTL